MKLKVLLISVYNRGEKITLEEMGVCFLTSYLRERGYEVKLICTNEDCIDYRAIQDFAPGIIGITVYYYTKQAVYDFCAKIRQRIPGVFICVGGYLPTYYGNRMMKEAPFIDFAIRGEGEISFFNLISHLEKGGDLKNVKGLTYRDGDKVLVNEEQPLIENLGVLAPQARDILLDNKLKIASISTSRGCARKCSFCNTSRFWRKWRGRPLQDILREIKQVYDLGIRYFAFNDSSFEDSDSPEGYDRMVGIAQGILDMGIEISYIAGFRAEFQRKATPELMELLRKSGLRQVRVGVEAGCDSDRRLYGKYASIEDNGKIIELFRKYRIYPRVGFINFNPYSNFQGLRRNIDFLEKYDWAANFFALSSRLALYKGTRLYDKVEKDGLMTRTDTDAPLYEFVDPRIGVLANYIQGYIYLSSSDADGAPGKIYNYINYFQSIVYDFHERFAARGDGRQEQAARLVLDFEQQVKEILAEVNRRNAAWFRELLDLAENGWDNQRAFAVTMQYLNKDYLLERVSLLEEKKWVLTQELRTLGAVYEEWISRTWGTIEELNY